MAVLPYEMRWPLRHVFEGLRKGLPALGTALVTPFTLTVPQDRVVTWVGLVVTWAASECPLAPAMVPGKNIASEASAATESRPAGSRKGLLNGPFMLSLCGARPPRMPT